MFDPFTSLRPSMHPLGTGRLRTIVTPAGGSTSMFDGLMLTRASPGAPDAGPVVYVRALDTGRYWTAGQVPGAPVPDTFEGRFAPGCAAFRRRDGGVETTLEIAVSPENDVEVRRIGLANHGATSLRLEVTTYLEIALHSADHDRRPADASKPAVHTNIVPGLGALVAERCLYSSDDLPLTIAHTLLPDEAAPGDVFWETDRRRFLGRAGTVGHPRALLDGTPLSGRTDAVRDPVLVLRRVIAVAPGARRTLTATLGAGATRTEALTAVFAGLTGARSARAFVQAAKAALLGETP